MLCPVMAIAKVVAPVGRSGLGVMNAATPSLQLLKCSTQWVGGFGVAPAGRVGVAGRGRGVSAAG